VRFPIFFSSGIQYQEDNKDDFEAILESESSGSMSEEELLHNIPLEEIEPEGSDSEAGQKCGFKFDLKEMSAKKQKSDKFDIKNFVKGFMEKEVQQERSAPEQTIAPTDFLSRYPSLDLRTIEINREVSSILPKKISESIRGIVIEQNENELKVVVRDPSQTYVYDHIMFVTQGKYRPVLFRGDPELIEIAIEYIYEVSQEAREKTWLEWLETKKYFSDALQVKQQQDGDIGVFEKGEIDGPVIALTDRIIKEAISVGASDIHLEVFEEEALVRYRIDGVLHIMNVHKPEVIKPVVKRIKLISGADISQERVTQGGRISVKVADREFDLRVSIVPVPYGESIVMRLLNKESFNFDLNDLGFSRHSLETFKRLLSKPYGMMLVSGPTGSGKSTTLYASLKEINRPDRKLLTVEDPIEYEMKRINQIQVNMAPREADKKVTFAKALREFLRQDPDVILVGEIRDAETAAISVQAALTGHLLLSTIHTNDSVSIVVRLRDMGIAPYLVGSVLVGGLAQRLVRRICSECKVEIDVDSASAEMFKTHNVEVKKLYKGTGCTKCHNYGYRGRNGVYEILEVTPEISEMISSGESSAKIEHVARRNGMKSLVEDALEKAANGFITMEEVLRVTMA
jgi:type IV pilus assembly protein PilB